MVRFLWENTQCGDEDSLPRRMVATDCLSIKEHVIHTSVERAAELHMGPSWAVYDDGWRRIEIDIEYLDTLRGSPLWNESSKTEAILKTNPEF